MPAPGFPAGLAPSVLLRSLPYGSVEELAEVLPGYMRESASEVGDAILGALLDVIVRRASNAASRAAATSEAFATGTDLDFVGTSNRAIARQIEETDDAYRARLLGDADAESPRALLDAVYAITKPFYPGALPYYWERSDDDPVLYDEVADGVPRNLVAPDGTMSGSFLDGVYLSTTGQVVAAGRRYAARGQCTPQHALLWNGTNGVSPDAPGVWGAAVLAIPPFPEPGTTGPDDIYMYEQTAAPLIDPDGAATAAATHIATFATLPAATSASEGGCVYSFATDAATVASRVHALVATRTAFPVQTSILLDQELR